MRKFWPEGKSWAESDSVVCKSLFVSAVVSAAYIKVYLLENGICVAKKKTKSVRKSLDPLYNQVLVFSERPQGKVVQVRHEPPRLSHSIAFKGINERRGRAKHWTE